MDSNNWRVKRDPSEVPSASTPNRSSQQRRPNNGFGDSRNSPRSPGTYNNQSSPAGRSPFQSRDFRKPLHEPSANKAIEEGRRLYVGNLPYDTSVKDIEALFQDVDGLESINMAVDPMTGRNPSYCFIDLSSKDLAEGVMEMYNGRMFRQRPLKVKPGVKSGSGTGRYDLKPSHKESGDTYAYDRWRRTDNPEEHSDAAIQDGRRVFVGGIPRFENQADCNTQLRDFFSSFNVDVVGKPHPFYEPRGAAEETENRHYTFVDLVSAAEAEKAIAALNGQPRWGGPVKVQASRSQSGRLKERRRLFVAGLPEFPEGQEITTTTTTTAEAKIRELFAGFAVASVSKLFLPKDETKRNDEGNHCYCFVELESDEDADKAQAALDWKEVWNSTIRVKPAYSSPDKGIKEKQTWRS